MLKQPLLLTFLCLLFITDATAQTWNQKANLPAIARHRSTSFSIGNKGYVGLGHLNTVSNILFEDIWEYNPASNTWTQKADFAGGLRYHTHAFVIDGKAYVGTGRDGSSYQSDNWEYDPATNVWTSRADLPGPSRRGTISFVINNLGYVGSGFTSSGGSGTSNDFYAYDPLIDSWSSVNSFPGPARSSSVGFAIGDKGYMGTGDPHGAGQGLNDFWEYDALLDAWTQKANVNDSIRRQAAGFSLNGFGYLGTGNNPNIGDDMDDFWRYAPAIDTWVQVEDFLGISRRYMTTFVIAGKAYAAVGTNGINFNDLWEYNPNYIVAFNFVDSLGVAQYNRSSGDINFKMNNLPSAADLTILISNKEGQIIDRVPVTTDDFDIQASTYCIYRLVSDGKVVKSGKLIAQK
jgi:N-acetylneuraminic acid mutarotase